MRELGGRPMNRYQPKHRRCTQSRHHVWDMSSRRGVYGATRCTMCGETELFF